MGQVFRSGSQIKVKCGTWAVWHSGNVVGHINEVALRRAGLVLRWVTVRYLTKSPRPTQPGYPSVGRRNEY